ncbi:MAG TPA: SDR family oxidoreductase [Alphaproteobacteria bacterium]|jgi:gluconate 5-dehydrogenase
MSAPPRGFDLFSLKDQVFVVTGASSGIGLAIAEGLASVGAIVGLNSRSRERLEAHVRKIPESFALPFDVTDLAAGEAALDGVAKQYGRLDGLVCNAGARDRRKLEAVETKDFRALVETNLVAPYHLARVAARHMLARGRGRIIFITSLADSFAMAGDIAYPATKAGLAGLVRSMAVELGERGINVNGIAPGTVRSEMNAGIANDPQWKGIVERSVPLKRWAEPAELAGAAIFLASAASSYVNGQVLFVDGGTSILLFN